MDDLIVIILMIVFILTGVIVKTKKKPAKNIDASVSHEKDDLWTLPGEITSSEKEKTIIPEEGQSVGRKLFPGKAEHYEKREKNNFFAESEKKIYNKLSAEKKKTKFPLKKAVIYSEILKRKFI